jgi:hypothetical protein
MTEPKEPTDYGVLEAEVRLELLVGRLQDALERARQVGAIRVAVNASAATRSSIELILEYEGMILNALKQVREEVRALRGEPEPVKDEVPPPPWSWFTQRGSEEPA